jgi:hypothetical protein
MTDDDTDAAYRSRYRSAPGDAEIRETAESDDGMMDLRIPIASSGEVRNEGDEPLTRAELKGMAQQVNDLTTGVFAEHGVGNMVTDGHYSQFEKLGYWADGEIEVEAADDGEDLLMATARMPDPSTLPSGAREYKQALIILREQAKRGIPIDASIGWREDGNYPGGVDLMEASLVGIGADPRTNTSGADPVATVTRAAVDAGADPADLVAEVERAVGDDDWSAQFRFFRVVAPEDREDEYDDSVLGVGVSFPESGVYVDWHTSAFPDELENPHVSEYGSLDDLRKATGNDIADMSVPPGARAALAGTVRPLGPPADPERFDDWDDCVDTLAEDPDLSREDAEEICGAWEAAKDGEASADTDTDNMTDDSDPPDGDDAGGTTDEAQDADDGETDTRAPEDVSEDDLLTFTAMHFEGMDEGDLGEAVDAADGEYIGECDPEALADLVSTATGAEYDDVVDAMDDLMAGDGDEGDPDEDQGDYGGDGEDDEDDEDRDAPDGDADGSDADRDADDELLAEVRELREEQAELRDALADGQAPGDFATDPDDAADAIRGDDAGGDDGADTDETRDADPDDELTDEWLEDI